VSVTGLPEPRADHAVAMARFARDCRDRFTEVAQKLEVTLGPETADLSLRIGLHSGPVTAGVLRGQKSRFQLFGDTVNTAARMESTGKINRIQITQTTADLLIKAKKSWWLEARSDKVSVKGKGLMQTYWVEPSRKAAETNSTNGSDQNCNLNKDDDDDNKADIKNKDRAVPSLLRSTVDSKTERLVSWNVDVLGRMLLKLQIRRGLNKTNHGNGILKSPIHSNKVKSGNGGVIWSEMKNCMVLNEVKEVIELPDFDKSFDGPTEEDLIMGGTNHTTKDETMILSEKVRLQLRQYVTAIAVQYRDNGFHNFEHASHVCMSVAKLLSRIVAPDQVLDRRTANPHSYSNTNNNTTKVPSTAPNNAHHKNLASDLHDHTHGITSDPLTQFACLFAALIHDVDHPGVSNAQLVKEGHPLSTLYHEKSVAEQNSVNVAWTILQDKQYGALRNAICETQEDEIRFRQLVVNTVMSTDIMDRDLKRLREDRWHVAFACEGRREHECDRVRVNRKATIVIEHLIQASDVAHTMQHWHIYSKWNERFFIEQYTAYHDGRVEKDPSESWYEGEISFFDYYIIPLAKKLSECGVFGVSSDEYLNYALLNRNEWEKKGRSVVADYMTRVKKGKGMDRMDHESSIGSSVSNLDGLLAKDEETTGADQKLVIG
jgi:hypothetical protein